MHLAMYVGKADESRFLNSLEMHAARQECLLAGLQ
jgi:hypothetical protein